MPVPNVYEDGSAVHGTGDLTVPWGTHNDTFYGILVVVSNGETIATPTGAGQTWTRISDAYAGTPGAAGSTGLAIFYCKATSGSMSAVTVADTGDHTSAKMWMLQNVVQSGNPINFAVSSTVETATTAISIAAPSSTVNNCLVFAVSTNGVDTATNQGSSGWVNASLTSMGFAGQFQTANGNGGGYMACNGQKVTSGACGTFTHSWAAATKQANITFAISDTATNNGSVGTSAGVATATAVGDSVGGGSFGTSAGVGAATGTSTEILLLDVPATPGSVASGSWPATTLENGIWKFQFTPGAASYTGFHALISSGATSGYGVWIIDNALSLVDTSDNIVFSRAFTASIGSPITVIVDMVANNITISGATTGNGTQSFTPGAAHWVAGTTLWIGQWTSGQWTTAGTVGDLFEHTVTSYTNAVGTVTGSSTAAATGAALSSGVRLGDYGSARQLFGASATSATAILDTQASGSLIVICTGGRLTDLATPPTDSHGNTWTALGSPIEFHDWPNYGIRIWYCADAVGGATHTFTQTMTLFDEVTIVVAEVIEGVLITSSASAHPDNGQALTVGAVTTTGPAYLLSFFSGDAPTGTTTTISPSNGYAVIDESTMVDHPNGYVPIALVGRTATTPGSYGVTYTESPDQGAILWNIAVQGTAVSGTGATAATSSVAGTGRTQAQASGATAGSATASATSVLPAAVGNVAGTATATGSGRALFSALGSVVGTSATTTIGGALARGVGLVAAITTLAAVGSATTRSAGTTTGVASATSVGRATATGSGTIAGSTTTSGVGLSHFSSVGISTAAGTAAGTGRATAAGVGTVAGVGGGSATARAIVTGVGTSNGLTTAAATGTFSSAGSSVGTTSGSATATGAGRAFAATVGTASALSVPSAAGQSTATAAGVVACTSTSATQGRATHNSAGVSNAFSFADGATGVAYNATGTCAGTATCAGVAQLGVAIGTCTATSNVAGVGAATSTAVGTSSGSSAATSSTTALQWVSSAQGVLISVNWEGHLFPIQYFGRLEDT